MAPRFLEPADILDIHRSSIEKYGGEPSIRDLHLLESAIAQPKAMFGGQFLHEDLPAMAAAYLFHLVSNHPFVDGNKRTGALAAFVFLQMNKLQLTATEEAFGDVTLAVAQGQMEKSAVADFIRAHVKPMV